MPDYSKLALERDIYGELGWIPNFHVKLSKNNHTRHNNYREFFDAPREYHNTHNQSSITQSEFFRENAPDGSIAKERSLRKSPSMNRTQQSLGAFSAKRSLNADERMSFSNHRTSKTRFATSFVLQPDISNQYKYSSTIKDTVEMANSIPFLRDHRDTSNL